MIFTESVIQEHPRNPVCSREDFNCGSLVAKEIVRLEPHGDWNVSMIVAAAYGSFLVPSQCTATDEQAQMHLSILSFYMETPVLTVHDS